MWKKATTTGPTWRRVPSGCSSNSLGHRMKAMGPAWYSEMRRCLLHGEPSWKRCSRRFRRSASFTVSSRTFWVFGICRLICILTGFRSRLTIPETVVWQLTPMKNPVTGEDEYATLLKPTGFTSKRQELCATETFRLTTEGLSYDHSGKYGEFSPFEYTSA